MAIWRQPREKGRKKERKKILRDHQFHLARWSHWDVLFAASDNAPRLQYACFLLLFKYLNGPTIFIGFEHFDSVPLWAASLSLLSLSFSLQGWWPSRAVGLWKICQIYWHRQNCTASTPGTLMYVTFQEPNAKVSDARLPLTAWSHQITFYSKSFLHCKQAVFPLQMLSAA